MNCKLFVSFLTMMSSAIVPMELSQPTQYAKVPSLQQLAFNAVESQIIGHIKIAAGPRYFPEQDIQLQKCDIASHEGSGIVDFALNNDRVQCLLKSIAYQHYISIKSEDQLFFKNEQLSGFEKYINKHICKEAMKDGCCELLPFTNNLSIRTICIVGNKMICAPLSTVIGVLGFGFVDIEQLSIDLNNSEMQMIANAENTLKNKIQQQFGGEKNVIFSTDHKIQNVYDNNTCLFEDVVIPDTYDYFNAFSVCFSPNKRLIATQCVHNGVYVVIIYDLETGEGTPLQSNNQVDICFSCDSTLLFTATQLYCYAFDCTTFNQEPVWSHELSMGSAKALCSVIGQEVLVLVAPDTGGSFSLLSANQQDIKCLYSQAIDDSLAIVAASFSSDGSLIALGCSDGRILLVNRETGAIISTLFHKDYVYGNSVINKIVFNEQGTLLFVNVNTKMIQIWDIGTSECIKSFGLKRSYGLKITGTSDGDGECAVEGLDARFGIPLLLFNIPCSKDYELEQYILNKIRYDWLKNIDVRTLIKRRLAKAPEEIQEQLNSEQQKRSEIERQWQEKFEARVTLFNRIVRAIPVIMCFAALFTYLFKK